MKIIKRSDAKSLGLIRYFTGNPCPKGHISQRFVSGGNCIACLSIHTANQSKSGYFKSRYEKNKESISLKYKETYALNAEKKIKQSADWVKNNPEKSRAIKRNYKSKRRSKELSGDSTKLINEWVKSQEMICKWCGKDCSTSYHIDHIYPLSKGGEHRIYNLCISCPTCNLRKQAKLPEDFARQIKAITYHKRYGEVATTTVIPEMLD